MSTSGGKSSSWAQPQKVEIEKVPPIQTPMASPEVSSDDKSFDADAAKIAGISPSPSPMMLVMDVGCRGLKGRANRTQRWDTPKTCNATSAPGPSLVSASR